MTHLIITNIKDSNIYTSYSIDSIIRIVPSMERVDGRKGKTHCYVILFKDGSRATYIISNWTITFC